MRAPVLLLVFNRPDSTTSVMDAIRIAEPPRLYIAADGARERPGEAECCANVRKIATSITWPCEVKTLFRERNLGLRGAVVSAVDWFFDHENAGIILEDDCVPHVSFFSYCDELLDYYVDDERVMAISGDCFGTHPGNIPYSYYFSRYFHCWGWASWRRAWRLYDRDMKQWPEFRDARMLRSWCDNEPGFEQYWSRIFSAVAAGEINTWDYQFNFTCWMQNGLTCIPSRNLVTNIGFGPEATHTSNFAGPGAELATDEIALPLCHPPIVCRSCEADKLEEQLFFSGSARVTKRLKRFVQNLGAKTGRFSSAVAQRLGG